MTENVATNFWPVVTPQARAYDFDESKHPRKGKGDPGGGQFAPGGGGASRAARPGLGERVTGERERGPAAKRLPAVTVAPGGAPVWAGEARPVRAALGKQQLGDLAEGIVVQWLRQRGAADAAVLNVNRNNFPLDLIQDHEVIEVKAGLVSNGPSAQHWRSTIGEPGKKEKAWLAKTSEGQKAAWNARKQAVILRRKEAAVRVIEKHLGRTLKRSTVALIVDPDRKTADLYKFDGFHARIGWNSDQAAAGRLGTVRFAARFAAIAESEALDAFADGETVQVPPDVEAEFQAALDAETKDWLRYALARFPGNGRNGRGTEYVAADADLHIDSAIGALPTAAGQPRPHWVRPCRRCGYADVTHGGACFGCAVTGGLMRPWEARLFRWWLARNPEWPRAHEFSAIDTAARDAEPPKSPEQADAGNYPKGHARLLGLDVSIENPAGSKRKPEWPALKSHYGYFPGHKGKDKDHIDVFVKPGTAPGWDGPVFVVNQTTSDGAFDEHKVMAGWPDAASAREGYLENYTPSQERNVHSVAAFDAQGFRDWLERAPKGGPAEAGKAYQAADPEPLVLGPQGGLGVWRDVEGARTFIPVQMGPGESVAAAIDRAVRLAAAGRALAPVATLAAVGLPPEHALKWFEDSALIWKNTLEKPLLANIQTVLMNGLRMGLGVDAMVDNLREVFRPWVGALADDEDAQPHRLETMVRTNATAAFNAGREAQAADSVADGFIVAAQYSAIIDFKTLPSGRIVYRTTPVCRYLDGRLFLPDSAEFHRLSPPRHWQCRSIWSFVTRTEMTAEEAQANAITAEQATQAVELSGQGFAQEQPFKMYETPPQDVQEDRLMVKRSGVPAARPHAEIQPAGSALTQVNVNVEGAHSRDAFDEALLGLGALLREIFGMMRPVVHVAPPVVNVSPPVVHVAAPVVHVDPAKVYVPTPQVHVEIPAPVVHIAPPAVTVEAPLIQPAIHVAVPPQPAPVVNVTPLPQVVAAPESQPAGEVRRMIVRKQVIRNERGQIIEVIEDQVPAP